MVKLDASGNPQWREALITAGSAQTCTNLLSIIQASDGSYVAAGAWGGPAEGGVARLLVKLDSSGDILWQQAYRLEGDLGSVIYSVHQTSDGGYVLAGDGDILLNSGIHLEPWIGKVDATGNPLWQHCYYQGDGEYFAASALAAGGGVAAVGWTEGANLLKLLFVVQTDSAVHPATPFTTVNPGLTMSPLSLPVGTTTTPGMSSPGKTRSTAIQTQKDCGLAWRRHFACRDRTLAVAGERSSPRVFIGASRAPPNPPDSRNRRGRSGLSAPPVCLEPAQYPFHRPRRPGSR